MMHNDEEKPFWILDSVVGTTASFAPAYPFFVSGRYRETLTDGSTRFHWHVPDLKGFDFSEVNFIDNAALKAMGL